jgi:phosphosulfolactate phosphohydrolase-like enzyme
VITFVFSLFTALANIKAIAEYVDKFASAVALWYVQRQQSSTLAAISDAAALASRAQTDEDRYKAAKAWQDALSRPRVGS